MREREYKDMVDFNSMGKNQYGVAKCWRGTSYPHWKVMSDIVWKLVNEYEMKVLTEVIFKKGGRADIFAYSGDLAVIIEVLHSEKDKKLEFKKSYYPKIPLIKVYTKTFDLEKFCI